MRNCIRRGCYDDALLANHRAMLERTRVAVSLFDSEWRKVMIAIREAWQQTAGRKTYSLGDLSRLCARILLGNRYAAGIACSRTLATGFAWRTERKSLLRIDGTVEPHLCSMPGSAAQAYVQSERSFTDRHLFCRAFRQRRADSRRRSAHRFSANRTSSLEATKEISL